MTTTPSLEEIEMSVKYLTTFITSDYEAKCSANTILTALSQSQAELKKEKEKLRTAATGCELTVIKKIERRQVLGIRKYKTTVEDNQADWKQWIQHAQDEAMDLAIYLQKMLDIAVAISQQKDKEGE